MAASDNPRDRLPATGAVFATTLWSVVLAAGNDSSGNSVVALEKLCTTYWLPIYAFLRRKGHSPADAEDLTQGFFLSLLEHNSLASISPERGRFRSFLLASLRYFLADQRDRANALKRGGGRTPISLDADSAEAFYARQTAHGDTPERCFERSWADALLRRAQQRLREECVAAGKQALFDDLGPVRSGDRELSYADIAVRHGFSENAARLAAFRLRQRYQELVSDEVRQTVATPEEVEDEIRYLLRVISGLNLAKHAPPKSYPIHVSPVCSSCGTPLPEKVREGFCPVCTLQGALQTDVPAGTPAALRFIERVGDYELIEEIARGGVGAVYKARQISLGRNVALKLLLAGHFADPKARQRFRAEAEATARLRHPNIVTIHEVGEHDGQPFIAMEFIEGGTLAGLIRDQPLPSLRAAACVAKVARAIAHAHAHGIVHRDLKPSNVLLDRLDEPRVTDFGLAKELGVETELTLSGQVLGSPAYMSPEQAMGRSKEIGPASDVYSLGTILYELLTARPLFQGSTPHTVIEQVKSSDPVPPRRLNASIPADVETVCLKCLEKEPARRYASAQEFADDLERFLRGEPVRARPVSAISKTVRWARRHRGAAAAIATCVVALIAITALASVTSVRVSRAQAATEKARVEATRRLAESLISEAHALRISGQAGFRVATLTRLSEARALDKDGTLRDRLRREAIAALVRPDIRRVSITNVPRGADAMHCSFDARFERCANATSDGRALYRVSDGELLQVISGRGRIPDEVVSFSPDARFLLLRFERAMQLVEAETARIVLETNLLGGPAAFSSDGKRFARAEDAQHVAVYEFANFSTNAPAPAHSWKHDAKARLGGLAFDPTGRQLAVADESGAVSVRNATSGHVAWQEQIADAAWQLSWSADGEWLAVAADRDRLFILNGKDGTLHRQINTPTDISTSLAFSPDGGRLACAGPQTGVRFFEPRSGRLLIADSLGSWHLRFDASGQRLGTFLPGGRPSWIEAVPPVGVESLPGAHFSEDDPNLTFSADGQRLLATTLRGAFGWNIETRQRSLLVPGTSATFLNFGSGSNELLISHRTAFVAREVDSGRESLLLTGGKWFWGNAQTVDGRYVAVADHRDDSVTLIERANPSAKQTRLSIRSPERIAFSPDGRWLAAGAFYDGSVSVWDWQKSTAPVATLRPASHLLHFSRDGQWLLTYGRALRLWRTSDWQPVEIPIANNSFVTAASLSADNRWLAITQSDRTVHLIDVEARRTVAVLEPSGEGAIRNVVFHPGGKILALSRGHDEVQLWDLPALRSELARLGLNWAEGDP